MPWTRTQERQIDELSCTACRGSMSYDARTQSLVCVQCAAERPSGTGRTQRKQLATSCQGCGAHMAGDGRTLAAPCAFCGTGLIGQQPRALDWPNAIIPFHLSREQAELRVKDWLRDMPSRPSGIEQYANLDRPLRPVYLPFYRFTYRSGANESVTARSACPMLAGFLGKGDLLELTWSKLPIRPFHSDFIAGHVVTLPELTTEQAVKLEERRKPGRISPPQGQFRETPRWDRLERPYWDLDGCLHVLAPVWLGSYRWDGQRYAVAVDGSTGMILGARPEEGLEDIRSVAAIAKWTFLIGYFGIFALIAGIIIYHLVV